MISLMVLVPTFCKPQDHVKNDQREHEKQDQPEDHHQREKRTLSFFPDTEDVSDVMDEIPGGEMLKAMMKSGAPPQPVLVGFVEQPVPVQVAVPYPAPPPQYPRH